MLLRLFRYPILLVCIWNLIPGIFALSHDNRPLEVRQATDMASANDTWGYSSEKNTEVPCKNDCDDENCADHQCHFGHCRILGGTTFTLSIPQGSETCFATIVNLPRNHLAFLLFKPPTTLSQS